MRKWLFLIILIAASCAPAVDSKAEEKAVGEVFAKYLESVKTADPGLGSQIWLQSPDATAVTPLAQFKGWQSIRDDLYVGFLQKGFAERNLQAENFKLTVAGNAAWSVYDWTFTAKLPTGQAFSSKGWETHVYQKVDGACDSRLSEVIF